MGSNHSTYSTMRGVEFVCIADVDRSSTASVSADGSKPYCKHSARLPVMLVAERTADRPAHLIQGFHCFDCGRDIAEKKG